MKKITFILALIFAFTSCQNSGKRSEVNTSEVEEITKEEALNLLQKWTDAYLSGDAGPLNEILDDTWEYSGSSDGTTTDKSSAIMEFTNADYRFEDIVYQNLEVKIYGDIAVLRGSESMTIIGDSGDTTLLKLRFTDVYQKKNGIVKAIATHSSPISDE